MRQTHLKSPTKSTKKSSSTPHFLALSVHAVCIDLAPLNNKGQSHLAMCPVHPATSQILYSTDEPCACFRLIGALYSHLRVYIIIRWSSIRSAAKFRPILHHISRGRSPFLTPKSINLYYLNVYKEKKKKTFIGRAP